MPARLRKPLGMLILLTGLFGYVVAAVVIGSEVIPGHWAVQLVYYVIAGTVWAFPLRPLLQWMNRPDNAADDEPAEEPL
jgi:membrane protein implicated in regulation of membrane protease activity